MRARALTPTELDRWLGAYVVPLDLGPPDDGLRFVRRSSMLLPTTTETTGRERSMRYSDEVGWALAHPIESGLR